MMTQAEEDELAQARRDRDELAMQVRALTQECNHWRALYDRESYELRCAQRAIRLGGAALRAERAHMGIPGV